MATQKRQDATRSDIGHKEGYEAESSPNSTKPRESVSKSASPSDDKLESWKEIAKFISRDQRTAMRWASELGMPVQRIPGAKRSRVSASKAEILRWQGRTEPDQPSSSIPVASADGGPIAQGDESPGGKRFSVPIILGILGVLVLFAVTFVVAPHFSRRLPVQIRFGESSVAAFDEHGNQLWSHQFSHRLDPSIVEDAGGLKSFVRLAEMPKGGGRRVILVAPYRLGDNPNDPWDIEIDCFSEMGSLLWSYIPNERFRFGDHDLAGPWLPRGLLVSETSQHILWAVFTHAEWGNSWVVSIDILTGRATLRFVNTGSVRSLKELKMPTATYLVVGGFNNEYDGPSIAAINERDPFASSPQTDGTRHKCLNCPPGAPDYYFVLPRSEVNRVRQVYEDPVLILTVSQGHLEASAFDLFPDSQIRAV